MLLDGPVRTRDVQRVQVLAERLAASFAANPERPVPAAARRLLKELTYTVEPDRWALADALTELAGLTLENEEGPSTRTMAYVEFDIAGGASLSHRSFVQHLDAIVGGVRQASGWLGGARLHFERLRDGIALTAWDPRLDHDPRAIWPLIVRLARDVYQSCLARGFAIRVTCCIDAGSTIDLVQAHSGGAGRFQLAAFLGMQGPSLRGRRKTDPVEPLQRSDGVAVVVPSGGASAEERAGLCDALWAEAGGELLQVVDSGEMSVQGQPFTFQVRRRRDLDAVGVAVSSAPSPS